MTLEEARRAAAAAKDTARAFYAEHSALAQRCADITSAAQEQIDALVAEVAARHGLEPDARVLTRHKDGLIQKFYAAQSIKRRYESAPWVSGTRASPKAGTFSHAGFVSGAGPKRVLLAEDPFRPVNARWIDRASLSREDEAAVAAWAAGKWPPPEADADLALAAADGDPHAA